MPPNQAPASAPLSRAASWVDVFPWLGPLGDESWTRLVEIEGTPERAARLADIADLAVRRLARWPLGQILPTLPPDLGLALLTMPARARNALARQGCTTTGDLADLELRDLLDLHNVGLGTVHDILTTLADTACQMPASPEPAVETTHTLGDTPAGPGRHRRPTDDEDLPLDWVEAFVGRLRTVARWQAALGAIDTPLLPEIPVSEAPAGVMAAARALGSLTPTDVLGPAADEVSLAALLDDALLSIGGRGLRILSSRLFADSPATLEQLGQEFGVTRERVRQIESKSHAQATVLLDDDGPVHGVATAVRALVGPLLPLGVLLDRVPALAQKVEAVNQPAWRVLDRLDDAYEIEDGWCAAPTLEAARADTRTVLEDLANPHGVVTLDDVQLAGLPWETLRNWLAHCGLPLDDAHVFLQTSSVADRAAALLSVAGEPLSPDELIDRMSVERSARSLRNQLAEDVRFVRADKDRWALVEWNVDAYQSIRTMIGDALDSHGGEVPLRDLVADLTSRYSVSPNSVVTYACAAPFETHDGVVCLASSPRRPRKRPEDTARIYRGDHGWLYRLTLTKDHLRGSGSMAPVAVATIAGLEPGQERVLATPHGPQAVRWTGPQPNFGTVRRLVLAQDLAAGTEVFFVLGDDATFRIEPIVPSDDVSPAARARGLVALPDAEGPDDAVLARAIGLDDGATVADLVRAYRERGDTEVAELLEQA